MMTNTENKTNSRIDYIANKCLLRMRKKMENETAIQYTA